MKLLQDLLNLNEATKLERNNGFDDMLEKWMDKNNVHHFEGRSGVTNFEKLIKVIGYRNIDDFLEDNSGCMEAMIEWITDFGNRNSEWKDSMSEALSEGLMSEDAAVTSKVRMLRTQLDVINKQMDSKQQSGKKLDEKDPLKIKASRIQAQIDQLNNGGQATGSVTETKNHTPKKVSESLKMTSILI